VLHNDKGANTNTKRRGGTVQYPGSGTFLHWLSLLVPCVFKGKRH